MRGEGREGAKARCHESGKRPWQRTGSGRTHAHTHSRAHTCAHAHTHAHTYTQSHTCTQTRTCTHTLVHLCTCARTCTHALTHSRTHRLPEMSAFPSPFSCRMTFSTAPGVTCSSLCRQAPGVGRPNGAPRLCDALGGWACAVSCPGPCPWARAAGWVPRGPVFWGEEGGPDLSASVCTGGKGQEPRLMVTSRIKQVMSKTQVNARVNSVNLPRGLASGPCSRARVEPSRPTPNWPRLSQP